VTSPFRRSGFCRFGRAIAEAAVAAGDVVVGATRRPEGLDDLVAAHPDQVEALRLDVADVADVTAAEPALGDVIARHGRIDVLVNTRAEPTAAPSRRPPTRSCATCSTCTCSDRRPWRVRCCRTCASGARGRSCR